MQASPTVTLAEVSNDFILSIWLQVYDKLDTKDKVQGRLVCKTLAKELALQVTSISISDVDEDGFRQQDLELLAKTFPNLTSLSISAGELSGRRDDEISFNNVPLPKLEHLSTCCVSLSDIYFTRRNTPHLQTLSIEQSRNVRRFYLDLPELESIHLEFVTVMDCRRMSQALNNCPKLETFSSYKFWGDFGVLKLNLPNASSLDFYRSDSLGGLDLVAPNLAELNLRACYSLEYVRIAPDPPEGPAGPKISVCLVNANIDPVSLRHLKRHTRVGKRMINLDKPEEEFWMGANLSGDDLEELDEDGNPVHASSDDDDDDEDDEDGEHGAEMEFLAMLQAMAAQFGEALPPQMVMAAMGRGAGLPVPPNALPAHGPRIPFPMGMGFGGMFPGMGDEYDEDEDDEDMEDGDENEEGDSEWETDEGSEDGEQFRVEPITDPVLIQTVLSASSGDGSGSGDKVEVKFSICNAGLEGWEPEEGEELTEDDYSPYVSLSDPAEYLKHMQNPDDIVIPQSAISVLVDYPLESRIVVPLQSDEPQGFKRSELAKKISQMYKQIYKQEERGSRVRSGRVPGMLNRNRTTGPYGIWGHDLGDLLLHSVTYNPSNKVVQLGIDS